VIKFRPPGSWNPRSPGTLSSVQWPFFTDVSGHPIGPVFKDVLNLRMESIHNLEDGIDRLSRNVSKQLPIYAAQIPRSQYLSTCEEPYICLATITHNGMTQTGSVINMVKTEIHKSKIIHNISFVPRRKQQVSAGQRRTVHWLRELNFSYRCCWRFKSSGTSRCAITRMVPDASNDGGAILLLRRERLPRRPALCCQNRTKQTVTLCGQNSSFITLNKASQPVITLP